jgi:peptide chain release factor 1
MSVNWQQLRQRKDELSEQLLDVHLAREKRLTIQKEVTQLNQLLEVNSSILDLQNRIAEAQKQLAHETDAELRTLFEQEIVDITDDLTTERKALDALLYPPDQHDERSVYVEIRAGAGGKEAALFAADLMKMYTNYALQKGWKVGINMMSQTELGGIKEAVLYIAGKGVYGHLKHESGVHRVQRVPQTEASGRVHTSTATIAVLPEAKEVDVSINPADLRIDVFRASGAGGQHVNTTDSAVRITHLPTGVVVSCQDERSQHKNKSKAMKMLQSRLLVAQKEKEQAEMSKKRKEQVGTGMRSEKVRTYNFPQNRVTDHQVGLTLKKLDIVMQGGMEEIVQALRDKEREERKQVS